MRSKNCYFCALHSLSAGLFNQIWAYNKSRTLKLEIYIYKEYVMVNLCKRLHQEQTTEKIDEKKKMAEFDPPTSRKRGANSTTAPQSLPSHWRLISANTHFSEATKPGTRPVTKKSFFSHTTKSSTFFAVVSFHQGPMLKNYAD